jgi:hypothetical protein
MKKTVLRDIEALELCAQKKNFKEVTRVFIPYAIMAYGEVGICLRRGVLSERFLGIPKITRALTGRKAESIPEGEQETQGRAV